MNISNPRRSLLKTLAASLFVPALARAQGTAGPVKVAIIEGLSGPFANTGEAVVRNIAWAVERINQRGGIKLPGGNRPLELLRYDSKSQPEEALSSLRAAIDDGARYIMQGNSSGVAAALCQSIS